MTEEVRIGGEYMAQTEPSRRERDQKTTDPLSVYQANVFRIRCVVLMYISVGWIKEHRQ
jgi:hypothetical protein